MMLDGPKIESRVPCLDGLCVGSIRLQVGKHQHEFLLRATIAEDRAVVAIRSDSIELAFREGCRLNLRFNKHNTASRVTALVARAAGEGSCSERPSRIQDRDRGRYPPWHGRPQQTDAFKLATVLIAVR